MGGARFLFRSRDRAHVHSLCPAHDSDPLGHHCRRGPGRHQATRAGTFARLRVGHGDRVHRHRYCALAGALLYISQTRDVWLGGTALLSMALGMGVPLVLVGVSEGALVPKSGAWMKAVKQFFGVLLLAVAVWTGSPVVAPAAQMPAWAALLIGSAMFLRAIDPLPRRVSGWLRLWKGVGIMALLAGAALVIGALGGSRDPLAPPSGPFAGPAGPPGGARLGGPRP